MTEPSTNSTIEWTIDCGWTIASICDEGRSKSQWASMTSRALFIIEALSMVTFGPIDQVGWFKASRTLAPWTRSRDQVRKGPPLAVMTSRRTSARVRPERRHWAMALCSLSTGRRRTPRRRTAAITIAPAATSVSLLAKAMSQPRSMAASVAGMPAAPTIAPMTMSPGRQQRSTSSRAESLPLRSVAPGASTSVAVSATATWPTENARACSPRSRPLELPARPTTSKAGGKPRSRANPFRWATTASVLAPIEPVEPSTTRRRGRAAAASS